MKNLQHPCKLSVGSLQWKMDLKIKIFFALRMNVLWVTRNDGSMALRHKFGTFKSVCWSKPFKTKNVRNNFDHMLLDLNVLPNVFGTAWLTELKVSGCTVPLKHSAALCVATRGHQWNDGQVKPQWGPPFLRTEKIILFWAEHKMYKKCSQNERLHN